VIPTIDIATPPAVCAGCGRQLSYLFCVYCSLSRLRDADVLVLAEDIQRMSKSQLFKTCATTDCLLCSKAIPAGSTARLLTKHGCAHLECVSGMLDRLDELLPRQEVTLAAELPFGDSALEVE
jgi:hypothetical protein